MVEQTLKRHLRINDPGTSGVKSDEKLNGSISFWIEPYKRGGGVLRKKNFYEN